MDPNPSPADVSSEYVQYLEDALRNLPPLPQSAAYIYRVPTELRKGNEHHYTPTTVSIGPYHASNPMLEDAGGRLLKFRALNHLLDRSQTTLSSLIQLLKGMEEEARLCYTETVNLRGYDFMEMMLLDGCFILALHTSDYPIPVGRDRRLFLQSIKQDLLLLENQLPFFVLEGLFLQLNLVFPEWADVSFHICALGFFRSILPTFSLPTRHLEESTFPKPRHLLELVLLTLFPSRQLNAPTTDFGSTLIVKRTISELAMHGIKPEYFFSTNSLADISFSADGVLKIPLLYIKEFTISLFKNLLTFEMCSGNETQSCFVSYLSFMDMLIDTDKDVDRLLSARVLETTLNDKQALVSLLSDLATNMVVFTDDTKYFADVYDGLARYCDSPLAKFRANFRRYYYDHRWHILNSFFLFILTLTQTLFAILSYFLSLPNPKTH